MHDKNDITGPWIHQLRETAEAQLERELYAKMPPHLANELMHELRVYRIELEMQNEALRQTQRALEESRDRYFELFEFAPMGYLSLSVAGIVREINFTGINLLGTERRQVLGRSFVGFVLSEDRDSWYRYLHGLIEHAGKKDCELHLLRGDGSRFYARLNGMDVKLIDGQIGVRITLTDITEQKQAEALLAERTAELAKARDDTQAASRDQSVGGTKRSPAEEG